MTDPHAQAFFEELDRRISCPDYPPKHRDFLFRIRPALRLLHDTEPGKFREVLYETLPKFFPGWMPDWEPKVEPPE